MNISKKEVIGGVFWKFSERILSQLVSLIISIVLARLLAPSEYGVISLVMVFITIANVFVTSGFGASLIQKKDADTLDFSTVLYFGLAFSIVIYIVLFFAAIPIAEFYEMPILRPVLRVLMLSVPIMSINSVQQAYVSREMIFKKFFWSTLGATLASAVVGIIMAYNGFGVWALVAQNLSSLIVGTIILQISIDWRPTLEFSFARLKSLFEYGWKLLVQGLVLQLYSSLRSLVIGKIYTASDLAYYTKGNQFPDLITTNIDTAINTALFPAMAKEQGSIDRVKMMARRTNQVSSYVMCPVLMGFIAIAEPFISLLLTDKWLPAVPYLRISCIILLFRPAQTAILQAVKAIGRSDVVLKIDFPVRIFALVVLMISVRFGVLYFAMSEILITVVGTILYAYEAKKIIGYSPKELMIDFMGNVILAAIMGLLTWYIGMLIVLPSLVKIIVQIMVGVVSYVFLSIITKSESYEYVLNTVKEVGRSLKRG